MRKCENPSCGKETDNPSGYCCDSCRINHECLLNPRKSNEALEKRAILKAYLNCVVLPNIPDKNLPALEHLLEKAVKISETQGNVEAKKWLKDTLERLKQ